jgi:hypothetical protein
MPFASAISRNRWTGAGAHSSDAAEIAEDAAGHRQKRGSPLRYILCPECMKRGLSHHPSKSGEYSERVKCRYCEFEREMSSYAFWVGIWGHDPGVQKEQATAIQTLNDNIRKHMATTGATEVRLKRIGRTNDYQVEFE